MAGGVYMETKADKIAGVVLAAIFFALGIWALFVLPADWLWYQKVLMEISLFGCSLGCLAAVWFGLPSGRK